MKKSIVLATAVAAVLTSGVASAELTANAGIFSNYIWRGVTQTDDSAAGQGGIDWGHDSGLYVGTWVSTLGVDGGNEIDVYAGFAGKAGSFGYDLGVITYQYPIDPSGLNFTEVYVSGSIVGITAGLNYTVDKASLASDPTGDNDLYLFASYDFSASDIDYSVYVGDYSFDADVAAGAQSPDYSHYGASIGKNGFGFAVDKNDKDAGTDGNVRFTVSYSKDFQL
jgi:uncharacterized protein (TIGR02001 family)